MLEEIDYDALSIKDKARLNIEIFKVRLDVEVPLYKNYYGFWGLSEDSVEFLSKNLGEIIFNQKKYFKQGFINESPEDQKKYMEKLNQEIRFLVGSEIDNLYAKRLTRKYQFILRELSKPYLKSNI